MRKSTLLTIGFFLSISGLAQAQAVSGDFQKNCVQEQLAEHKDIKKKSLTEDDFKPYCKCLAEYVAKNSSNREVNELLMNPKAKPEWLKEIERKAMKSCLASDSKMST